MFQENLRLKRRERGLSQEELASRLHVVRQTISKWEKGQSVPDAEQLIKLGLAILLVGAVIVSVMDYLLGLLLILPSAIPHIVRLYTLRKDK